MFLIDLSDFLYLKNIYFLFGLIKYNFGVPNSEEYLPEGVPGILKFCEPWVHS